MIRAEHNSWSKDIDSEYAESKLRSLNSEIEEVEVAMNAQSVLLQSSPDSFAFQISMINLKDIHDRLTAEKADILKDRMYEKLFISLNGTEFDSHTATIKTLSSFLNNFQAFYSFLTQKVVFGVNKNRLSEDSKVASQLLFSNCYAGSFGVELLIPSRRDMLAFSNIDHSLKVMFGVFNEEDMGSLSGTLGKFALRKLQSLLKVALESKLTPSISWDNAEGARHQWRPSYQQLANISTRLAYIKDETESTLTESGFLAGGSLLYNKFEFKPDNKKKRVVKGEVPDMLLNDIKDNFGQQCTITYAVRTSYNAELEKEVKKIQLIKVSDY